jgi:hypothetical protein
MTISTKVWKPSNSFKLCEHDRAHVLVLYPLYNHLLQIPHVFYWSVLHEYDDHVHEAAILLGDEQESKLGEVDKCIVVMRGGWCWCSSAITHLGASPIHMYKTKARTILILIIPMLVVKPKLHENALALCSFISYSHYVVLCLVSYFSLLLLKNSFHFCLKPKVALHIFLVILAKSIFDRSR